MGDAAALARAVREIADRVSQVEVAVHHLAHVLEAMAEADQ